MRVVDDEAYRRFLAAADDPTWPGARIKDERSNPLQPGGRATVTLFEKAQDNGRAHPRVQVDLPPATDPAPPERLF